jgi:hypothetical protein
VVIARWEGEFNDEGNEFVAPIDPSISSHPKPSLATSEE